MKKLLLSLLILCIARGVAYPDYSLPFAVFVIPIIFPLVCSAIVSRAAHKHITTWKQSIAVGLLAVYLSEIIGVFVYGYSNGWQYITKDVVSQAIILGTIAVQTVVFLIGLFVGWLTSKRYNQSLKRDEVPAGVSE